MKTKPAPRRKRLKNKTWEYPKGSGIRIAEMPNKTGGLSFGVSYQVRIPGKVLGVANKREMFQRSTKAEAERLAEDRLVALKKHGTEFSKIPPTAQTQAAMGWSILEEHNTKTNLGLNLIEVIRAGIRTLSPAGGKKTVPDVVDELAASKTERFEAGGLDGSTLHDFKTRGKKISKAFAGRFASDVLHTEIEQWLKSLAKDGAKDGSALAARSVRNYRNTLAEIFRHAKARRYCSENPMDRFTKEDLKALGGENKSQGHQDINILTVAETKKLLGAVAKSEEEGMLASTVLRLFCGIRTTETCKLDWSEVQWLDAAPFVHVPAGKAKKRRIRHVEIPANALAWLKLCNPPASGPIVPGTGDPKKDTKRYCDRFGRIAKTAEISQWESNDTRHSFGSYHYALYGDAAKTSALLGHKANDDTLFTSYRSLVKKADGMEFFNLMPDNLEGTITTFPNAAAAS